MYFIADDSCVMHVYFSAMWRRAGLQGRVCVVGENAVSSVRVFCVPSVGISGDPHVDGSNLTAGGLYAPPVCRNELVY